MIYYYYLVIVKILPNQVVLVILNIVLSHTSTIFQEINENNEIVLAPSFLKVKLLFFLDLFYIVPVPWPSTFLKIESCKVVPAC